MNHSSHPISVLFLFATLPVGGAENLLLSVTNRIDKKFIRPIVCCIGEKGAIGEEIEKTGVTVLTLNKMKKGGFDIKIVGMIRSIIREYDIKLIHTNLYHANLYGRLAALFSGIPAVASVYNTYPVKPHIRKRLFNRLLAPVSAAITVVSKEIRDDLIRWDHVPAEKIRVLPSAIDFRLSESTLSHHQARSLLGLTKSSFVVGAIGRLEEQKGHAYLLRAAKIMIEQGRDVEVIIAGDGRLRGKLEHQAQDLNISERVHFLGMRRDLGNIFRAMNALAMPSLWEGLSLVLLSTMAAKVPIVATHVGNAPELIGDNRYGILIPPQNAEKLANTLAEVMDNPEAYTEMTHNAEAMVKEQYGEEKYVSSLVGLYAEILNMSLSETYS